MRLSISIVVWLQNKTENNNSLFPMSVGEGEWRGGGLFPFYKKVLWNNFRNGRVNSYSKNEWIGGGINKALAHGLISSLGSSPEHLPN